MSEARNARRALLASRALLAGSAVLFLAVTWLDSPVAAPAAMAARVDSAGAAANAARASVVPRIDLARLVARDPFSPFRAAPDVAYQIGVSPDAWPAAVERQSIRLLGTIVRADGRSFAMCQLASQPVRMIYAGERIGTLTLETVSQGGAVFIDDSGARVTLRVARTGE